MKRKKVGKKKEEGIYESEDGEKSKREGKKVRRRLREEKDSGKEGWKEVLQPLSLQSAPLSPQFLPILSPSLSHLPSLLFMLGWLTCG